MNRKRLKDGTFQKSHGYTGTKVYNIWKDMLHRCSNKNHHAYKYYGNRGIKVSKKWLLFSNFILDMGEPKGKSLERRNNNKGYSKNNCFWATKKQQANNRRSNRFIEYNGQRKTLSQWADVIGLKSHTIARRIRLGWTVRQALTMPLQQK